MLRVNLVAREAGILCGEDIFAAAMTLTGPIKVTFQVHDGERFATGDVLAHVHGPAPGPCCRQSVVALNFVQRLCGIATLTAQYVAETTGTKARIVDTRKTTPGLRLVERYAVRCGGGHNHRFSLSDALLAKDNHLAALAQAAAHAAAGAARAEHLPAQTPAQTPAQKSTQSAAQSAFQTPAGKSILSAFQPPAGKSTQSANQTPPGAALAQQLRTAFATLPHTTHVEIEIDRLDQLETVLEAGAHTVLLDNFTTDQMRQAVQRTKGRAALEASGNMTLSRIREVAATGVNLISVGALTHSPPRPRPRPRRSPQLAGEPKQS